MIILVCERVSATVDAGGDYQAEFLLKSLRQIDLLRYPAANNSCAADACHGFPRVFTNSGLPMPFGLTIILDAITSMMWRLR